MSSCTHNFQNGRLGHLPVLSNICHSKEHISRTQCITYLKRIKDDCHFKWYQFGQTIQLSETHVVNTCWVSIFYLHILKNELLKQVQIRIGIPNCHLFLTIAIKKKSHFIIFAIPNFVQNINKNT